MHDHPKINQYIYELRERVDMLDVAVFAKIIEQFDKAKGDDLV
ncbi:hypothetical protein CCP3SC15_300004 [Gammaproteobacteria bacterium]